MQTIKYLQQNGYDVFLTRDGDVESVQAKRRPDAKVSPQAMSRVLLELSRKQDEAIVYMRSIVPAAPKPAFDQALHERVVKATALHERIMNDPMEPDDTSIAAAIAEYNIAIGRTHTSDGLLWTDVLREYQR